ncbi:unnamed protein product [Cylicocyclus nassatus]|uniref:G-protein coupled receptors family 1 profile domain-containing protein n=1 Tax=Cylicocyclus nassatus TaxID=53992 RepID=A0AA36H5K4_CYLNA|nr:unnamed protein product [Cylicocyclus nassatus]
MNATDDRLDEVIAGIIMGVIGTFGIIMNLTVVYLICCTSSFHNAFGYICASHLLADVGLLTAFLFWATPASLLGLPQTVTDSLVGKKIGQFSMLFWYASMYGQLQLAVNRLLSILTPIRYNNIFSKQRTFQILGIFWIISFLHIVLYFWDGCDFRYDVHSLAWLYADTPCGTLISFYGDFAHGTALCIIVISMNTVTCVAICKEAKRLSRSTNRANDMAKFKRNIQLYIQVCIQACCFALMISSFHLISRLTQGKWPSFFLTTFVWETCHALDGVIMFFCCDNFRRILCRPANILRIQLNGEKITKSVLISTRTRI